MRCIMVMYDSLNRHMLPCYPGVLDQPGRAERAYAQAHAPNFQRLAQRAATFDTSYVCSMPCMPARRDFHTARPNFLHTSWAPLQPYDDSVPAMLDAAGVHTHLATDHYHYFEDGGANYHNRYSTWRGFRGQEGDPWWGHAGAFEPPKHVNGKDRLQDWVNRTQLHGEEDWPQTQTFNAGLEFIAHNKDADHWLCHIETFDPHEPFTTCPAYKAHYPSAYNPDEQGIADWPAYGRREDYDISDEQFDEVRRNYAALVTQCDANLGRVLDMMDRHDMWKDTMLVVWTDHGFMLGEHGWVAKNLPPMYDEVARTPMLVWDPRHPEAAGQRRGSLVQPAIDLGPTLLEFFGVEPTEHMMGRSIRPVIADDTPIREAGIFGYFGDRVNITDGRHVYMRGAATENNGPLHEYTLMPMRMRGFMDPATGATAAMPEHPFGFAEPFHPIRYDRRPAGEPKNDLHDNSLLFDTVDDPAQDHPLDLHDAAQSELVERLSDRMTALMREAEAPAEQFARMGLSAQAAAV